MVGGIFLVGILQLFFKTPEILPQVGGGELAGVFGGGLFMLVWLTIWTLGGGFALYTFLWQLAGKENVEISNDMIQIQRAVFGFGLTKEYLATHIKDLRITPWAADHSIFGWSRNTSLWGLSTGLLAFDYGAKTFRFGGGIDEAEAKQILEKIVLVFRNIMLTTEKRANNACTRLGVRAAFFGRFRGLKLVPAKWRSLLPPQAGNANR